ncbi:MAG: undecaprenyl-diphosphatase UppP [Chloroflexota bacterium]|nr:undecaprenyl-diphosphatase UppP [Chloroflexota bacterium]
MWQALLLGILQGATEFLPVSSSGHLVILPRLLGWPDPGLMLDTILHLGTMVAVILYFWRALWSLALAAVESLRKHSLADPQARIAWGLVLATIPAAFIGWLLEERIEQFFQMPRTVGGCLLVTALLLLLAEYGGRQQRDLETLSWRDALLIGLAQTLAMAPGISRSGMTIAAGLLLGYRRAEATRFSFLLAVPIILGSGFYQLLKLTGEASLSTSGGAMWVGFLAAGVTGYFVIAGLLALVRRHSLWPFAAYCAIFGLLVATGVLG